MVGTLKYASLVNQELPALAVQLARLCAHIGDGEDWGAPTQSSLRTQVDWSRPFERSEQPDAAGGYVYSFNPYRDPSATPYVWKGRDPRVVNEFIIRFSKIRVVDIISQRYGPLDTAKDGPPDVSVQKYPNDTPDAVDKEVEYSTQSWTDWSRSWALALETEFSETIKAGSEAYGIESETQFKVDVNANTAASKAGGSSSGNRDLTKLTIDPWTELDVLTSRQPVSISQSCVVTGAMDLQVEIELLFCYGETAAGLDDFLDLFRGIGASNVRIRDYFADPSHVLPESDLKAVKRPAVELDLGIDDIPGTQFTQELKTSSISHGGGKQPWWKGIWPWKYGI